MLSTCIFSEPLMERIIENKIVVYTRNALFSRLTLRLKINVDYCLRYALQYCRINKEIV